MSDLNWKERLPKHHNGKFINSCMVHEFAGYVSRCWDSDQVFESEKALIACENLISYLGSELEIIDHLKKVVKSYEKLDNEQSMIISNLEDTIKELRNR